MTHKHTHIQMRIHEHIHSIDIHTCRLSNLWCVLCSSYSITYIREDANVYVCMLFAMLFSTCCGIVIVSAIAKWPCNTIWFYSSSGGCRSWAYHRQTREFLPIELNAIANVMMKIYTRRIANWWILYLYTISVFTYKQYM